MKFEKTITLRVLNWPRFCRTTTFSLDARIFPDEGAIRRYALGRFGTGQLRQVDEETWEYERDIPGPQWWWKLLSLVLNKSYV